MICMVVSERVAEQDTPIANLAVVRAYNNNNV